MATLSGGHLAVDFASGAVPALLPFFVLEFDLSYTATAVLMLAVLVSSSLVQPLFGLLVRPARRDLAPAGGRRGRRRRAPGSRPSRRGTSSSSLLVFIAGIGIAAFHPEGAKFAAYASGRKRASGMSLLQHRREHGVRARADRRHAARALARPRRRPPRDAAGPRRGARAPAVAARRSSALAPRPRRASGRARSTTSRAMTLLGVVIALRSVAWFGLLTFVPLWVVSRTAARKGRETGCSRSCSSPARPGRSCSAPSPIASGFGGRCSSRRPRCPFLVVAFVAVGGVLGTVALMLVGLCVVGTFGVTMVLSQLYLPRHVGMASGLSDRARDGPRRDRRRRARRRRRRGRPRDRALRRRGGAGARLRVLCLALPAPAAARRRADSGRRGDQSRLHRRLNRQSTRRRVTR